MGRTRRINLPGAPFHLTARLQDGKPLFSGLEHLIVRKIASTVGASRARLLAFAVMSNHLHLVVIQDRKPLSHLMQPLLRGIAGAVRQRHGGSGHVFQGRYRAHACLDARRLRSVLVYVHLNPVRAGLCRVSSDYAWTSGIEYDSGASSERCPVDVELGLRLYGTRRDATLADCRDSYRRCIAWRLEIDALQDQADRSWGAWAVRPLTDGGDDCWWERFQGVCSSHVSEPCRPPDLEVIATSVLDSSYPDMPLQTLRSGAPSRALYNARKIMIERATAAGYANHQIARYLRISESAVSRAVCRYRANEAAHGRIVK